MGEPITQEKLAAAIFKAKGLMEKAIKASINPHFKSSYADFGAVKDATEPGLTECELSIEQRTGFDGDGNYMLFTWFQHVSGAKSEPSLWPIIYAPDKPQVMGSSLTYGRRYQWGLICGIASEIDDDGNKASTTHGTNSKPKSAAQIKQPDQFPLIERSIRACKTVDELKRYALEAGRIMVDWREMDKRHVRAEYDRRMTELTEGVTEDGNVENG